MDQLKNTFENLRKRKNLIPLLTTIVLLLLSLIYRSILSHRPVTLEHLPAFRGMPYVVLENNQPNFDEKLKNGTLSFEQYSELDRYGRCRSALARIGSDLFPHTERESITDVCPTGWQSTQYDFIDGHFLYNRCHLIGYQLTGENQNLKNLITGTSYLNQEGMLPFENRVYNYIKKTNHHVLYRVTPIFNDTELVARGVQIEAYSVEDRGKSICFNVFVYNNQPDVTINYKDGKSVRS